MDAWGVDVMLAACQKGLMTPPGVAFTCSRGQGRSGAGSLPGPLLGLGTGIAPEAYYQLFCGTAPTHHIFGLREALDMLLDEEGLGTPGPAMAPSPARSGRPSRPGARSR